MNKKPWSTEEENLLNDLRKEKKTYQQIAKIMNRSYDSIRAKLRSTQYINNNDTPKPAEKTKLEYTRTDIMQAIANGTKESTPYTDEEMFSIFDIDPDVWTVSKKVVNTWANYFQTKLWLARNAGVFEFKYIQEEFNKWVKLNAPKLPEITYNFDTYEDNRLLEINIADPHFDKLSWGKESGDHYDIKIARRVFLDAVIEILRRASVIGFKKVLFIVGNDLFNSEGKRGTTTQGTPQESDVRWKKSFSYVIQILIEAIHMCSTHAPTDVIFVMGNHDEERTYYAGETIGAVFHKSKNVTVDNGPKSRKYYQWGKNLLQFLHGYLNGKAIKWTEIPLLIAQEAPKMWAESEFRYSHMAHWHHNKATVYNTVKDQIGVTIQIMPSIAGTDGWHYDAGFIGSNKQAKGFIYDKNFGQIFEINYYAPRYFYID